MLKPPLSLRRLTEVTVTACLLRPKSDVDVESATLCIYRFVQERWVFPMDFASRGIQRTGAVLQAAEYLVRRTDGFWART